MWYGYKGSQCYQAYINTSQSLSNSQEPTILLHPEMIYS